MKFLGSIFIIVLFFMFALPVMAQTPTVSLLQRNARAYETPKSAENATLGTLQQRILTEIDRRITVLTNSLSKLAEIDFLSSTEKNTISQKIQNEINTLTQLKTEIQAETEMTILKEKAKLLLASHRTFAFFFPQIRILTAADMLNNTASMLFDYAEKLEARIAQAKASGNNTSALETNLATMKSQITSAQTLTTSIMSSVTSASADAATNRIALQNAGANIKKAKNQLRLAFQTGSKIKAALLQMTSENDESTSSSSASSQ